MCFLDYKSVKGFLGFDGVVDDMSLVGFRVVHQFVVFMSVHTC